ncbi:MAG: sulfatase-like hydrolase/transferase, partial [bacterium]|nr:sulfatase-like hydrolase/transferase [bacterium]
MSNEFRRRDFIKTVGLGTAALASHTPGSVAASSSHPNVLVIHVDQHRFDCLSVTGNPDVKTPHIDALAGDSVLFENSFCPFPVCTPSRYSLLSGQYVHQHGGFTNRSTLSPAIDTFPKLLRAAGYKTKAVGKMHFTPTYLDVGFDEMELSEQDGEGRWDDDYHRFLMQHDLVDRIDLMDQRKEYRNGAPKSYWDAFGAVVSGLPEKYHSTTWVGDRSIDTLNTWDASQPHLLMAGFIKPHHPFDPPAPWHQMYDPDTLTILPGWTEECLAWDYSYSHGYFDNKTLNIPALKRCMAYYYATISQIDHHVGRMIEVLKKKNLYDNTMII